MAAGSQVSKTIEVGLGDIRQTVLPSLKGVAAGTYNLAIVVAANGTVTLRLTEPISDATLTSISTLTVKDGIITAKA